MNGVYIGRRDTNVLSLMTSAVNKTGLAVTKTGRPAVKRTVGRKTNLVNAVSLDDDSTSVSSSYSSCYIDFSFKRVAEEATVVYAGLLKTSGYTHRCLHSRLYLGNPHVLAGAEWWTEEDKPRLLACVWIQSRESRRRLRVVLEMVHNLLSCVWRKMFRFDFGITTDQLRCTSLKSPLLRTRLDYWRGNATWLLCSRTFKCRQP
jgi:hypothetical protein